MRILVLDTGALVALQRDRIRLRTVLRKAIELRYELRTSAPVLVEFLGGSPSALRPAGEFICSGLRITSVDESLARRAAILSRSAVSASRAEPSAVDALVCAEAERSEAAVVIDGYRADFEALAAASGTLGLTDLGELAG